MKYLLAILFLFLFAPLCFAAPSITTVATTSTTVTISGSSFGTKTTAAPIKHESFEWGSSGDAIDTGNDPVAPKWQASGAGGSTINTVKYHSGSKSAYKSMTYNSTNCAFYDSYIDLDDTEELYVSYWFYWDTADGNPFSESGAFFKLNRINGSNAAYTGNPSLGFNLTPHYDNPETGYGDIWGYTDDQTGGTYHNIMRIPSSGIPSAKKWHRVEMWLKLSSPAGATNGEIEYAINSVWTEFTGRPGDGYPWEGITLSENSTEKINVFTLLFGGCRFTDTSYPLLWQDDIYVDNTRARVEIGNNATWANCTHREIQIPTAWSDTSIIATINKGSFSSNDNLYIFVVDSDGTASAGKAITLFTGCNPIGGDSSFNNIGSGSSQIQFK